MRHEIDVYLAYFCVCYPQMLEWLEDVVSSASYWKIKLIARLLVKHVTFFVMLWASRNLSASYESKPHAFSSSNHN